MKIRFSLLVCLGVSFAYGSIIRDVAIHSPSMDKDVPASVILPDSYDVDRATRYDFSFTRDSACWAVIVSFFKTYFNTGCGRIL